MALGLGDGHVQLVALTHHIAVHEGAIPHIVAVSEVVLALIGMQVRRGSGAQQSQMDGIAQHAHAVFALIEHRCAAILVTQGRVAMVADLVAIRVIGTAAMGRALDIAILDLVDGFAGVNAGGEAYLQQVVHLVPVHMGIEVHADSAGFQGDILHPGAAGEAALHADGALKGAFSAMLTRLSPSSATGSFSYTLSISQASKARGTSLYIFSTLAGAPMRDAPLASFISIFLLATSVFPRLCRPVGITWKSV